MAHGKAPANLAQSDLAKVLAGFGWAAWKGAAGAVWAGLGWAAKLGSSKEVWAALGWAADKEGLAKKVWAGFGWAGSCGMEQTQLAMKRIPPTI